MKTLSSVVLLCSMVMFSESSQALQVLGCDIFPSPPFVDCVLRKKDEAVASVRAAKDKVIDDLENSPYMAKLQAEKDLLAYGRQGAVDLAACLSDAQLSYGTILSNAVSDPHNLVASRLQVMITKATEAQQPVLQHMLSRAKNGNPAAQTNMNVLINEAFAFVLTVARQDPVTNCAVPMLESQAQQIKQVIGQLYPVVAQKLTTYVEQSVRPIVTKSVFQMIGDELGAQTNSASSQQSGYQSNSRVTQQTPAQGARQISTAKKGVVQRRSQRSQPVSKKQPRTRAGGSFMGQAVQAGIGVSKKVIVYATPDDLTRFALGEFTARALPPPVLNSATTELGNLTAALNNGTAATVDTAHLQTLLAQLDLDNRDLYTRIALATLRKHGHDVIDDKGKTAIDFAVGFVAGGEEAAEEMVSIICSTGANITGTPCAGVKAGVKFLVEWLLLPTIVYAMTTHTHMEWDALVDCGSESLLAQEDVSADCTTVVGIIPWFPDTSQEALDFVMPSLGATQKAMEEYHRAVAELVAAAKSAG